jgi:hypothetical protein
VPFDLLRSREGERLSLVGSGIWSMMEVVQCGSGFATFERVERKVVLVLLCQPFSAVSVCVEGAVSLMVADFWVCPLWPVVLFLVVARKE